MKLKAGRSNQSYLLVATSDLHVFVWIPRLNNTRSAGVTVRKRTGRDWRHWRMTLWQRNARDLARVRKKGSGRTGRYAVRATVTVFELATWWTENGTTERMDMKSYVRLKVAPGGRRID